MQFLQNSSNQLPLMPKTTGFCKYHRNIILVAGSDDFFVADGAARLDDGLDPGGGDMVDAVAEGEKRI